MSVCIPHEFLASVIGQQQHAFRIQPDEALRRGNAWAMRASMNFVSKKVLASSQEVLAIGVCGGCLFVCLLQVPASQQRS